MESQEGLGSESDSRLKASTEEPQSGNASPESGRATHVSSGTIAVSPGEAIARRAKQGADSLWQSPSMGSTSCLTRAVDSSAFQRSSWLSEDLSQSCALSTQQDTMTMDKESMLSKQGGGSCSHQLEFQDSHLSPALPLLPANFANTHSLFENTTFHQTDFEFGALRGSPDVSVVSEQFPVQLYCKETGNSEFSWGQLASDRISLSQHSLTLNAASLEDASSCCSISEHTMSPASVNTEDTNSDQFHIGTEEEEEHEDTFSENKDEEAQNFEKTEQMFLNVNVQEKSNPEENTLNVTVPAKLSDVSEKVAGDVASSNSLFVSRPSSKECKISKGSDPEKALRERQQEQTLKEHGWQGSEKPTQDIFRTTDEKLVGYIQPLLVVTTPPVPKQAEKSIEVFVKAELSSIADQTCFASQQSCSNGLHQQMCCDMEELKQLNPGIQTENQNHSMPEGGQSVSRVGTESGRESTILEIPVVTSKTEAQGSAGFSFEQGQEDRELLSSGNHTLVDGSFLKSLSQPMSQSTPEVFPRVLVPRSPARLSPVMSKAAVSLTSASKVQSGSSKQSLAAVFNDHIKVFGPDDQKPTSETFQSSRKIQALPSMNYMEKVGAWNTNQSSGEPYFDNMAFHGLRVMFPKKKAFETVSDTSNHMIAHQERTLISPTVSRSSINNRSPKRNLAACFSGNVTSVKEDPGCGGSSLVMLLGRSQSIEMTNRDVQLSRSLQVKENASSGSTDVYAGTRISDGVPAKDPAPSLTGSSCTGISQRWTFQTKHTQDEPETHCAKHSTEAADSQEFRVGIIKGYAENAAEAQSPTQLQSRITGLGHFGDVSSNRDLNSTLASSQDSYHCGQKMAVSTGAVSSVVSLEVDNYAPYWTTNPSTPAKTEELNIEERIPIYLHNLGINQSPSTILTPFVPIGPIREPEFSPTDLRTIKGSTGTPTKSMQPSEGNTPEKEFSRSSLLSLDSSTCVPLNVDSGQPKIFPSLPTASSSSLDRPLSQSSLQTAFHQKENTSENALQGTLSHQHPENEHIALENTQSDESLPNLNVKEPLEKFKPSNLVNMQDRGSLTTQLLTAPSPNVATPSEEVLTGSLVCDRNSSLGTKTLQEIRTLLGKPESTASGKSSFTSSPATAWGSDSSLLGVERKLESFQDISTSSAGNLETSSSLIWEKSISESLLTSEELKNDSVSKLLKSVRPLGVGPSSSKSARSFVVKEENSESLDGLLGQTAESYPTRSVRREPEGCSAGIPDKVAPMAVSAMKINPSDTSSETQQQERLSHKIQPQEVISLQGIIDGPSATLLCESSTERKLNLNLVSESVEAEQENENDSGSIVDSLAARVASLLRNESPGTVTSSQASVVDKEEHRVREWLNISGEHCGLLDLNAQDRQRIEEIKRELLLGTIYHGKSQLSSETDSSSQLSSVAYRRQPGDQALRTKQDHRPLDSVMQQKLEARIREIACREGLTLSGTSTRPMKSINLSSYRTSPTQSGRLAPSPSGFVHLPVEVVSHAISGEHSSESQEHAFTEKEDGSVPHSEMTSLGLESDPSDSITTLEQCEADLVSDPEVQSRQLNSGMLVNSLSPEKKIKNGWSTRDAEWCKNSVESSAHLAGTPHLSGFTQAVPLQLSSTGYRQISRSFPDVGSSSPILEPRASPVHITSSASVSSITSQTKKFHSQPLHQPSECTEEGGLKNSIHISSITSDSHQAYLTTGSSTGPISQNAKLHGTLSLEECPSTVPSSYFPGSLGTQEHPGPASKPLSLKREQEPVRNHYCKTAGTPVPVTTSVPRDGSRNTQPTGLSNTFTPSQKLPSLSQPVSALPALLPYKPHGSQEAFYVPQAEAPLSPVRSNSTMESSHPGSDDAVPPKFSPEVLGSRDQEEDRSVTMKHTEGVYSKRQAGSRPHGGPSIKEGRTFPTEKYRNSKQRPRSHETTTHRSLKSQVMSSDSPVYLAEHIFEDTDPVNERKSLPERRPSVGGLSLVQSLEEEFAPLQGEVDYSLENLEPCYRQGIEAARTDGFTEGRQGLHPGGRSAQQSNSNLGQSHHGRSSEWARSTPGMELSLLERLERLSRFIHSSNHVKERASLGHWSRREADHSELRDTRAFSTRQQTEDDLERTSWRQDESLNRKEEGKGARGRGSNENGRGTEHGETSSRMRRSREQLVRQAWKEGDTQTSTHTEPSVSQHHYPAERDRLGSRLGETDAAVQTESTDTTRAMSTIDMLRLFRAFGPQRVTSGMERLHTTIDRQREIREQSGRRTGSKHRVPPASESNSTDNFTVNTQSVPSTSSDSHLPYRGRMRGLQAKSFTKLVNKGIQAGDLEIVSNGTRKHTRDVGTTFPSPQSLRRLELIPFASGGISREQKSPPEAQSQDPENGNRSSRNEPVVYPPGVSWFIPTDNLKDKQKKENRPNSVSGPGPVWFAPFIRAKPWREPLKERQVQDEPMSSRGRGHSHPDPDAIGIRKVPTTLVWVTLQEALEMRRPDFISCSRERIKKLGLRAEERRLQAMFAQEREDLFNQPTSTNSYNISTGPVYTKRVIPKKEMFMRSKKMYCRLPEVQRRKEEERRQAEYHSYRLKAQLYKKKITNHVLGRKTPWQ